MKSRTFSAIVASTILLTAVGCGSPEARVQSQAQAASALRQAATSISDVDPVTFKATVTATLPDVSDEPITLSLQASSSVASQQASGVIDLASLARILSAKGLAADLGDDTARIVVSDGVVYIGWPSLLALTGTEWVSITHTQAATMPMFPDPQTYLEALTSSLATFTEVSEGNIEVLGTGTVNGTDVTNYSFSVRAASLFEGLPADLAIQLANAGVTPETVGSVSIPVTASVDSAGIARSFGWSIDATLARQLVETTGGDASAISDSFALALSFEIVDFGQPLTIELPDASEVTDVTSLLASID